MSNRTIHCKDPAAAVTIIACVLSFVAIIGFILTVNALRTDAIVECIAVKNSPMQCRCAIEPSIDYCEAKLNEAKLNEATLNEAEQRRTR